jgi:hypothetical protein
MDIEKLCSKLAIALFKVKTMNEQGYLSYLGMHSTKEMVDDALVAYAEFQEYRSAAKSIDEHGPAIENHPIAVIRDMHEEYEHGGEA